jgi:probable HAF family extracellular repeat protein
MVASVRRSRSSDHGSRWSGVLAVPIAALAALAVTTSGCTIPPDTLQTNPGEAFDANDAGWVVGYYSLSDKDVAFLRRPGRPILDLGSLADRGARAAAVSENGIVAGYSNVPVGDGSVLLQRPFLWRDGVGMVKVPIPDGMEGYANDVNSSGFVVGWYRTPGDGVAPAGPAHAYGWRSGLDIAIPLPGLGGESSGATAVNDAGVIVGSARTSDGTAEHAVLWQPEGALLHPIDLDPGWGARTSHASDINRDGLVVGVHQDGTYRATVWSGPTHAATEITDKAWITGVNDRGVLFGAYAGAGPGPPYVWPAVDRPPLTVQELPLPQPNEGLRWIHGITNRNLLVGTTSAGPEHAVWYQLPDRL